MTQEEFNRVILSGQNLPDITGKKKKKEEEKTEYELRRCNWNWNFIKMLCIQMDTS